MCPEVVLHHLKIEQTAHALYKNIVIWKEIALTWACEIYQFLDLIRNEAKPGSLGELPSP